MNNPTAGITAVILASGFSKRMGCNKLLLPVEGKAMIAHVFDAVRQVEFEQTVVVTGFDSIAQLAVGNGFQAVDNDSPEIGQSHSVVLGVQKTSQSAGWMFFNGDMPWLKSDTIGKLLEYADAAHIVVPRYGSRPGQPVYFPAAFKAELLALTGDHDQDTSHDQDCRYNKTNRTNTHPDSPPLFCAVHSSSHYKCRYKSSLIQ